MAFANEAKAQRIVVDTASTSKYRIKAKEQTASQQETLGSSAEEEMDFSDRALSIGKGILNRLKARFNLEETADRLKDKKEQILGKKADDSKSSGG